MRDALKLWRCVTTVEKFDDAGRLLERRVIEGNIAVSAGLALVLDLIIGAGGTAFNNANAHIGVGDSTTAAAIGQTDLQAATNKFRRPMEATFPSRAGSVVSWKSSYATGEANFAWNEWAVFNASTAGTMLNRKVESLGTKSSGVWTLQVDIEAG
jgi:hypothetical protein